MSKKAVVWIRDDFRIKNNSALSYATNNYDTVTALYIYNKENFDDVREAQKWWVSKSLINFKDDLIKYNIELELVFSDAITFFSKIKGKQEISIFWNKIYEPSQFKFDNDLIKIFEKNKILSKCFKGNVLNEYNNVTKDDGSPYKVYSPFWRVGEQIYLDSIPNKSLNVKKVKSKIKLFKNNNVPDQILPKKNWYKKFEKYWDPSEKQSEKYLNDFVESRMLKYGDDRDYPAINGSSKLSPFIRNGQIHVCLLYTSDAADE